MSGFEDTCPGYGHILVTLWILVRCCCIAAGKGS